MTGGVTMSAKRVSYSELRLVNLTAIRDRPAVVVDAIVRLISRLSMT